MGSITRMYEQNFLQRYDKDDAIPYYSVTDFPDLTCDPSSFRNTMGVTIAYFLYHYDSFDPNKLILLCPGIGPGHTSYLAEIETLCRAGYRVLTLDYTGCGASGGDRLYSINAPTKDVSELLDYLHPQEEILPIGHSLGGYTVLNLAHLRSDITKAVVISGFVSIADEMKGFVKLWLLANTVKRYERNLDPNLGAIDNRAYLSSTKDRILWIHSTDDPMVNYKYNAGRVAKMQNRNVRLITFENKKHNPQYTVKALETMNAWIGEYSRLVQEKKLDSPEARQAYFSDKPIQRMTEQDASVWDEILRFLGQKS